MTKSEMRQEIVTLRQELREYSDLFDLQHTIMKKATAMWQAETGNKCLPDLGTLLEWLMGKIKTTPKGHNHIWREGPMPVEEKNRDALLASIIRCGNAGRWLRGGEIAWGAELEAKGEVSLCCGGEAATFIDQSNTGRDARRGMEKTKNEETQTVCGSGGTPSRPASGSGMLLDCEGCWTHSIPIEDCDGDNCPLCGSTMLMEQGDQFDASVWGGGHNRIYVPNGGVDRTASGGI